MLGRDHQSRIRRAAEEWLGPPEDRRALARVVLYSLATRLLLCVILYAAVRFGDPKLHPRAREEFGDGSMLAAWLRWDTWWYLSIVHQGYSFVPGYASNVAFLPGYPALIALFEGAIRRPSVAALVASNLSFCGSVLVLWSWVRERAGALAAERSVLVLLLYPLSFFMNAAYAEAPFFLLCLLALRSADSDRWRAAGVYAALATLTRPMGLFLAVAFAWEYWRRRQVGRAPRAGAFAVALPVVALSSHLLYLWIFHGTPLALLRAQADGWDVGSTLSIFELPKRNFIDRRLLDVTTLALPLVLSIFVARAWRKLGAVSGVYAALSAALGIFFGGESLGREALAVVPAFAVCGIGSRTTAAWRGVLLAVALSLYAVFVHAYCVGRFMG